MYGSKNQMARNGHGEKSPVLWSSRYFSYEKPLCVTGAYQIPGLEQAPKSICKDRIIGTRKGTGVNNNDVDEE